MDYTVEDGRITLHRTREERRPLQQRLARVEGQVRGLAQMVDTDRHCLEVVQQVNAITAALREVAVIEISQHVDASVRAAVAMHDGSSVLEEMTTVLRTAIRHQTG